MPKSAQRRRVCITGIQHVSSDTDSSERIYAQLVDATTDVVILNEPLEVILDAVKARGFLLVKYDDI